MKKSKKKKIAVKKFDITTSASYQQGRKDGFALLRNYSLFFCCAIINMMGAKRKSAESNVKLHRYCEGLNDVLEESAKAKNLKIEDGWIDQSDIGR